MVFVHSLMVLFPIWPQDALQAQYLSTTSMDTQVRRSQASRRRDTLWPWLSNPLEFWIKNIFFKIMCVLVCFLLQWEKQNKTNKNKKEKPTTKSNLGKIGSIWLTLPHDNPLLRLIWAKTSDRNLEKRTMEESCFVGSFSYSCSTSFLIQPTATYFQLMLSTMGPLTSAINPENFLTDMATGQSNLGKPLIWDSLRWPQTVSIWQLILISAKCIG